MSGNGGEWTGSEIALIGMACRVPGARTPDEFWRNVRDGIESIRTFSDEELRASGEDPHALADPQYVRAGGVLDGMELFDGAFFGFGPRDSSILDPQHRHFLEACWEALEHSGYDPSRFAGSIGVFGGSGMNAYLPLNLLTNPELVASLGLFLLRHTGNDKDFLTTRVSYALDLKGPSYNVQTACSTSLVAVHLACQSLLNRECDMALAGGVTIELPHRRGYLYRQGEVLSPDGHCRAFDETAEGTVFGSGVGVVVLRRLDEALAARDTIHAVIKGSAINNDGAGKVSYLAPSVDGQSAVVAEALAMAGVSADSISYIETHGTGTRLGDPIEVEALTQAYRRDTSKRQFCGLGSVKTNIGHLDTAAGVASLIKAVQALVHGQLPPSLNFTKPNSLIDFETSPFYVNNALREWRPAGQPRRAGVSSLGVGGTNAHLIIEEAPAREAASASRDWQLFLLSAKTLSALDGATRNLSEHLRSHPEVSLADTAHTLHVGRQAFQHSRMFLARSREDAMRALDGGERNRLITEQRPATAPLVAFMFPGGGAQYPNMGQELYQSETVYRAAVDECFDLLSAPLASSLRPLLFPAANTSVEAARLLEARAELSLPAIFVTSYALAKQWMAWGIEPQAMIGHSMGEYLAAHLAGVMTLGDALSIVATRGRLFDTLPAGAMLSVALAEEDLEPLVGECSEASSPDLAVAAVNGPESCTVSGSIPSIERLERVLTSREVEFQRLKIAVAAHSPMLEPILEPFRVQVAALTLRSPERAYISNLTGTWIRAEDATDPGYWVRHLRHSVRFAAGIATLLEEPGRVLLEVGPGHTLCSLAKQQAATPAPLALPSLRHPRDSNPDLEVMLQSVGRLWMRGVSVDWAGFYRDERRSRIPLPTYAFDHQRHWIEPGRATHAVASRVEPKSLTRLPVVDDWFYRLVWKRMATAPATDLNANPARWLVFADECGIGHELARLLVAAGHEPITVTPGQQFSLVADGSYTIDPRSRRDYADLVRALQESGGTPSYIVHLWSITVDEVVESRISFFESCQERGFYSLLFLAQALDAEGRFDALRLLIVSNGMQRVRDEPLFAPEKAPLIGICRVVPQEYPSVATSAVDLDLRPSDRFDRSFSRTELARRLLVDALVAEPGAVIARRGAERWVQTLERQPLDAAPAGKSVQLRQEGAYLITGGLGGIGYVYAEYLARTLGAKLALVGRTVLPDRSQWANWLNEQPESDRISRLIRKVQSLEALGASVLVLAADVSDRAQMRSALETTRRRFGRLSGVIHAAGVLGDGLIGLKSLEAVESVFAPKARGALILDDLLRDEPLDFFALFSSTSVVLGTAGQVDYTGANAFLNALAESRASLSGCYVTAIDWGLWQQVGMAMEAAARNGVRLPEDADVGTPASHPMLGRRLTAPSGDVIFSTLYGSRRHWVLDEHRLRDGLALLPGTAYLDLAYAAASTETTSTAIEIRELSFLSPLDVGEHDDQTVRVSLKPSGQVYEFGVHTRRNREWREHARAYVCALKRTRPRPRAIAGIIERCNARTIAPVRDPLTQQDAYLNFGPRWQNTTEAHFGDGDAIARFDLPAEYASDCERYLFHPALVDRATSFALPLVEQYSSIHDLFVPLSYSRVSVFAPLPSTIYSYARYRANETTAESVVFDVMILDEEGTVLAEIDRFVMKRTAPGTLKATPESPAVALATSAEQPPDLLQLATTEGIRPEDGLDIFARVLSSRPEGPVLVSSLDLRLLLERTTTRREFRGDAGVKFARPEHLQSEYRAPEDELEKMLVKMWQDLLGIEQVGLDDNFFELGGESLIGLRFFNQLRKEFGVRLPLDTLFQAPTVTACAALVRAQVPAKDDSKVVAYRPPSPSRTPLIVGIQTKGSRPPLFCVHDQKGYVLLYRELAAKLGKNQPFYGIQASGLDGTYAFDRRIEDMAERYVQQLRTFSPQGPYFLAGSSLGGIVAYEMAQRLLESGNEVALLTMFDSWTPEEFTRWQTPLPESIPARALKHIRELTAKGPVGYYRKRLENRRWWREYYRMLAKQDQMRQAIAEYLRVGEALSPDLLTFHLEDIYGEAYRKYVPQAYPRDVVLFRATERANPRDNDPYLGWGHVKLDGLEVIDSPGPHGYMVREPYVGQLALHLRDCIDRAASSTSTCQGAPLVASLAAR